MLMVVVDAWVDEEGETYPGANAAVAGPGFEVLERFAVEVERDGAAVAASAVVLGGCVQIGYFGAAGRCILGLETGAVIWFDFDLSFVKVFEGADLGCGFFFVLKAVVFGEFLSGGEGGRYSR